MNGFSQRGTETPRKAFLVSLCLVVGLLSGAAEAATLDRLRAFVKDTQTARTQFTQTVVDRNGQINLPQTVIQVQGDKVTPVFGAKGFIEKPQYPMPAWSAR